MKAWTGAIVALICGCSHRAYRFREPFLWDDDAVVVMVHRADIAEAEGALIRQLREQGEFRPELGCEFSARAYNIFTSETEEAYQVFLVYRPELCRQAPGDATLPPMARGADAGPMEYAVSRKDLRVIRVRERGDPTRSTVTLPSHPTPKGTSEPQTAPANSSLVAPEPSQAAINPLPAVPVPPSGAVDQKFPANSQKDQPLVPCNEPLPATNHPHQNRDATSG